MKPHIKLKLQSPITDIMLPHWQHLIAQKALAITKIHPDIDALFSKYNIPVWVTQEYQSADQDWNHTELASGLNRVYRLILQRDIPIPAKIIQELSLLPIVESVDIGKIGEAELPLMESAQMSVNTDSRSRSAIHLDMAQKLFSEGDPEITVAILDTGVNLNHPEFKHLLLPGFDFVNIIDGANKFVGDYLDYDEDSEDEVGHGTHVAGIIAAKGQRIVTPAIAQIRPV